MILKEFPGLTRTPSGARGKRGVSGVMGFARGLVAGLFLRLSRK